MAEVRISDIIEPSVYLNYMQYERPEKNAFVRSGIIASPPEAVVTQMNAGGYTIDMPEWDDLDRTFPDIISDDPNENSTDSNFGTRMTSAVKQHWHKSWGVMDLTGHKATGSRNDPVSVVLDRMGAYWTWVEQKALIQSAKGLLADNVANDGNDMKATVYSDLATPLAANKISPAAVNAARLTMGDHLNDLVAIAVGSKVYGDMLNGDNTEFERDSKAPFGLGYYMGLEVIVDDDLPITAGNNSPKYTAVLLGRGAFGFTDGALSPDEAFERDRKPEAGNGGGRTSLHTRRKVLLHPRGWSFTKSSMAKVSPSSDELALAVNWDRKYDRKKCRLAYLETN